MKRFFNRYVLMDEASGAGGDAGAGGGAAGSTGSDGAGAAGSATGGEVGAGTGAGGSALTAGATGAAGDAPSFDYLPEKFIVKGEDGAVNLEASARKMAESYGNLERGRAADVPKAATDYAVTVPDNLKEAIGDLANDGLFTQFRDEMHSLGLSQKQFDGIMQRYFALVPAMAEGGMRATAEQTLASLEQHWPDEKQRTANYKQAAKAATQMARAIGVPFDEIESSGLANNPLFIRMMASLGPEMGEDTSAGAEATGSSLMGDDAVKKIMASDAYRDEKHPGFEAAQKTVRAHYNRKYGQEIVS